VQKIDADGNFLWQENGVPVCTEYQVQQQIRIASDQNGGIILAWRDERMSHPESSNTRDDTSALFAQRISKDGQLLWDSTGVYVSKGMPMNGSNSDKVDAVQLISHKNGSASITWRSLDNQVYLQRLDSLGNRKLNNGLAMPLVNVQYKLFYRFATLGDMAGGIFLTYIDNSSGDYVLYGLHVDSSGSKDWMNRPLAAAVGYKDLTFHPVLPYICSDDNGGFIITWMDSRNDVGDVYITRVKRTGFPHPVELLSFSATVTGATVDLQWCTASETNNHGFAVERSFNSSDWQHLGFVAGNGTTTRSQHYSFSDPIGPKHIAERISYYRLRQEDYDGSYEYSPVKSVIIGEAPVVPTLYSIYPNPVVDEAAMRFSLPEDMDVGIRVVSTLGVTVHETGMKQYPAGAHTATLPMENLASGFYYVQIHTKLGMLSQVMIKQ
jgi:type IX secretion system substrate protein